MKLLELLHGRAGWDAEPLARACGVSTRTLQRDLDALAVAGFPVFFDHGYRLAAPALLPAITLTVDQALALRLAAETAAQRAETATARTLAVAAGKLADALAAKPPGDEAERQLALPVQDPKTEACLAALTLAISERRTVRVTTTGGTGREAVSRRIDPYRLLETPAGAELLGYCHERRRILRVPVTRLRGVVLLQRRFRPAPARLVERHLHPSRSSAPELRWVRLACRPPLVQQLKKHPLVGSLMWEDGPDGSVVHTLGVRRPEDLLPWLLSCGDAVEVLSPLDLRQEVARIARAVAERHAVAPAPVGLVAS